MADQPIKSPEGKVYLRYYQPIPKYVQLGKREFATSVQHGISMLLVDEADVPAFLALEGGCCGGKRKIFGYASPNAVSVWLTGTYKD